ncbi:MAG: hypothetical protein A3K06_03015 [Candidatus Doudnabacteria bacterium RIFCSPHIGHO2_01_52_17]|uniref:Uncharacterized protein n=1 Tax=Candidatus Doudnabacteria bacterium RIFCSPHIGHO2_01_52_17 TaxID=1817820 RepID=A0A1F5NC19_9BACT|nr:MAG: hypothetical protein UY73_C0023G0006 [Parcubacteria group bacterium GW2011_GWA2_52_8]OGE75134.1 MAG: hypothetical protein A3K06_03015 [Candidatus Doudnabacteria bacterium RIFCSPHIGHO2_01_52_17]
MSILFFIIGIILLLLSHPKINRTVMARLYNEGWVTPQTPPPEKAEIVRDAGPRMSLVILGVGSLLASLFFWNH